MIENCPACLTGDSVEYRVPPKGHPFYDSLYPEATHCRCAYCGARFEIEEDADFDGESYTDMSTPGRRIFWWTWYAREARLRFRSWRRKRRVV
ncbi:MAG: hypothetical protein GY716_15990 [bacterium]|nr:hypothetical protein [bacterium]